MALFGAKPPAPPPPPSPPVETPARRFTDRADGPGTIIGPGTRVRGDIGGEDSVKLAGSLDGDITTEGDCHMSEGSRMTGSLMARNVVVGGELEGLILASGNLEIGARAVVRAEVTAATVAIAQGSFFDGQVHMTGGGQGAGRHRTFEEKRGRGPAQPT